MREKSRGSDLSRKKVLGWNQHRLRRNQHRLQIDQSWYRQDDGGDIAEPDGFWWEGSMVALA